MTSKITADWLIIDGISYIPSTMLATGIEKVSIKDNKLFAVLDPEGNSPRKYRHSELGFYFNDTRYITNWDMTINGQSLAHLSHEQHAHGSAHTFSMTNRDLLTLDGQGRIPRDRLLVRKIITFNRDAVFEHIEIINYDTYEHEILVEQFLSSTFDDIFEVRGYVRSQRGTLFPPNIYTDPECKSCVVLAYQGLDHILRKTFIHSVNLSPQVEIIDSMVHLSYKIKMAAKELKDIKTTLSFDNPARDELYGDRFSQITVSDHIKKIELLDRSPELGEVKIISDNILFDRCIQNARIDIEMLTGIEERYGINYPAAGVPWFCAPFGRDGIITAYQMLPWYPSLAVNVLDYVFKSIGTKSDSFTDEEPGKVFHEMRYGEMAHLKEIPYIPYYGSVDSTPLSLILLGEYIAWTQDLKRLKEWWPSALAALEWINKWGDSDGDMFLEYIKKSPTGLDNQGWKDSHNSIMHSNGVLANAPIRLCEVQAYAYRAKRVMMDLAFLMNDSNLALKLQADCNVFKEKFKTHFWDKEERYIYLALDADGNACKVMSSNQGHCLWGGILDAEDAEVVAKHLMSPRLFSGYGIRTLAADELAYNPLSYHNGSIWPHDNSICAEGFRYYDQVRCLQSLSDALFDVVAANHDLRLPELYCGFRRRGDEAPIPYEVACKPQAWAAGSVFLLLKSLLGISLAPRQEHVIIRTPLLPSRVDHLEIKNLTVRDLRFDVLIRRWNGTIHIEIDRKNKSAMQILVVK